MYTSKDSKYWSSDKQRCKSMYKKYKYNKLEKYNELKIKYKQLIIDNEKLANKNKKYKKNIENNHNLAEFNQKENKMLSEKYNTLNNTYILLSQKYNELDSKYNQVVNQKRINDINSNALEQKIYDRRVEYDQRIVNDQDQKHIIKDDDELNKTKRMFEQLKQRFNALNNKYELSKKSQIDLNKSHVDEYNTINNMYNQMKEQYEISKESHINLNKSYVDEYNMINSMYKQMKEQYEESTKENDKLVKQVADTECKNNHLISEYKNLAKKYNELVTKNNNNIVDYNKLVDYIHKLIIRNNNNIDDYNKLLDEAKQLENKYNKLLAKYKKSKPKLELSNLLDFKTINKINVLLHYDESFGDKLVDYINEFIIRNNNNIDDYNSKLSTPELELSDNNIDDYNSKLSNLLDFKTINKINVLLHHDKLFKNELSEVIDSDYTIMVNEIGKIETIYDNLLELEDKRIIVHNDMDNFINLLKEKVNRNKIFKLFDPDDKHFCLQNLEMKLDSLYQ
jgi:predicted nuclease with TOPRIM domain